MSSFMRYRHLEKKSEDMQSYQVLLRAFDRIDDLLQSLDDGVQVYRGLGAFEVQVPRPEEGVGPAVPGTLDYLIRKGEVEIQMDLMLPPSNGFSLARESMQQYSRVMSGSPKTRAIIVVWATEELESVVFEVGQIRNWLEAKDEKISISAEDLRPLDEILQPILRKYEPSFWRAEELQERRTTEFDFWEACRDSLIENYRQLVESAPRKRIEERRLAIESIAESEVATLADLLAQCIDGRLSSEELGEAIAEISQNVRLA